MNFDEINIGFIIAGVTAITLFYSKVFKPLYEALKSYEKLKEEVEENSRKLNNDFATITSIIDSQLAIIRIKLFDKLNNYLNEDRVDCDEFEQIDLLYAEYKKLKGNGTIDLLYKNFKSKAENCKIKKG